MGGGSWVCLSCVVGLGISYSSVWLQSLVTATSFLVIMNVSKAGVLLVEAGFMPEKNLGPWQDAGTLVSITSGFVYGLGRMREEQDSQEAKDEVSSDSKDNLDEEALLESSSAAAGPPGA